MSGTFSVVNRSAATLTKNRTEGSISSISGMCVTCVDGCIGMCEIGKSAYRGHEVIYPQPFGVITTASEKNYPVDYSHFNIMGTAVGAFGIEADMAVLGGARRPCRSARAGSGHRGSRVETAEHAAAEQGGARGRAAEELAPSQVDRAIGDLGGRDRRLFSDQHEVSCGSRAAGLL